MSEENFTRHNKDIELNLRDFDSPFAFMNRVKNCFIEGITCFRFRFGTMVSPMALRPEIHDESDAIALAQDVWADYQDMLRGRVLQ